MNYSFLTTWKFDAPIDQVYDRLLAVEQWPQWWKGVTRVQTLEQGDPDGLGALHRYVWRSKLPYSLSFDMRVVKLERPYRIEGQADGELAGSGIWTLSEAEGVTTAQYRWDVRTTKAWMNLFTPIARPLFEWNHDVVMQQGGEGLAQALGCRLLASGEGA